MVCQTGQSLRCSLLKVDRPLQARASLTTAIVNSRPRIGLLLPFEGSCVPAGTTLWSLSRKPDDGDQLPSGSCDRGGSRSHIDRRGNFSLHKCRETLKSCKRGILLEP